MLTFLLLFLSIIAFIISVKITMFLNKVHLHKQADKKMYQEIGEIFSDIYRRKG